MAKRANRNNAMAGGFLIGGVILTAAMAFWLGEAAGRLGGRTDYVVEFDLDEPLPTLSEGSSVTLAGQPVGHVTKIERVGRESADGRLYPELVEVTVSIKSGIALHEGTLAEMRAPLLGGVGALDIVHLGHPDAPALAEMGRIDGMGAGGVAVDLLAQLGITKADIAGYEARIESILANADEGTKNFEAITAAFVDDAQPTAQSVAASAQYVESFLARVGEDGLWRKQIDETLENVRLATEEAPKLMDDARSFVGDLDGAFEEYKPSFDAMVADAESTMAYIDEAKDARVTPLLEQWTEAGAQAERTGADYADLAEQVSLIVTRESKQVSRILAEVRLTSTQANLLLQEVRAAPWRLLKPPKQDDLAREPLYVAARAYAEAVADLRAVTESLDGALTAAQQTDTRPIDPEELRVMHGALRASYRDFEDAERRLLELLGGE